MCNNQIVQRNDHASFSVLGLAIILITGCIIMLFNSLLSTIWPRLRPLSRRGAYRDAQWESYELPKLLPRSTQELEHINNEGLSSIASSSKRSVSKNGTAKLSDNIPSIWQNQKIDTNDGADKQEDNFLNHPASIATIEVNLQQDDFPPQELADFLA